MRLGMVGACCAFCLVSLSVVAAEHPTDDGVVHGTINIALGNRNGLILLTDSMLTTTDANGGMHQLQNPGQKLFKLDDRTVCSFAGFASAAAPSSQVTASELNTNTSAIIRDFVRQTTQSRLSIDDKLRVLASLFKIRLAMIANVRDAASNPTPIDLYRFQLIIAGYDIDDRPKIGRIELRLKSDMSAGTGSLISNVEDLSILSVEDILVSKLNGVPDVAEQILRHPESKPQDAVIKLYAASLSENGGRSLTLEQMVELAKRLAYYTAEAHPEVGGPNQIAILRKSQTVSIDQPTFPEPPRSLPGLLLVTGHHVVGGSSGIEMGDTQVFVRCSWVGAKVELDGNYYFRNEFTKSDFLYDGGSVELGDSNRVTNSVLLLGPHAILELEIVRRLTATFSWSKVAYAASRPKPWQVVP